MRNPSGFTSLIVSYVPMAPSKKPNLGDLVLIIANFLDGKPRHGIVIKECSPQANSGYEILLGGKKKYFPPHLIRIVSRKKQRE